MTTQLETGDVAGARRAADLIPDPDSLMGSKTDLLERIAKRQAEQRDAAGVLAWAGQQRAPKAKLQALRGLADGIADRAGGGKTKTSGPTAKPEPAK